MDKPRLLMERFGEFLAELHQQGVYFRSIHLGNVVLQETEQSEAIDLSLHNFELSHFGLIDIADIKFCGKPLSKNQRTRNFNHVTRPQQDAEFFQENLAFITQAYSSRQKSLHRN